jgi:predicted deacylase
VIGRSVEGRPLQSYRFGSGPRTGIVFAGIHGGYEWNTILLARRLADHFETHPREIPSTFTLYIIPALNPDGLQAVTGGAPLAEFDFSRAAIARGRFNGRGVDLNRNFGATWEPVAYWGSREVDPGSAPFSEPETRALRDFVQRHDPEFVVSYHSAANGIYYGGRHERWEPSRRIARAYSRASGYPLPERGESLVSYEITGAAASYFYSLRIPAVTVELAGRSGPEFSRNLAGLRALLQAAAETEEAPPSAAGKPAAGR